MREIIKIPIDDVKPGRNDVLKMQGIPPGNEPPQDVVALFQTAMRLLLESSQPKGVISDISTSEFAVVYNGEGLNEQKTPLAEIFKKADSLALFAVTLGQDTTERIDELFKASEFALGSMLDSAASASAEKAAHAVEDYYSQWLSNKGEASPSTCMLRFSPGYCGWHMSGQKKLFEFLHPEDIDIALLHSFLMKPLKSISGVIVAGEKDIFVFEDSYSFCKQCNSRSCRDRIRALFR